MVSNWNLLNNLLLGMDRQGERRPRSVPCKNINLPTRGHATNAKCCGLFARDVVSVACWCWFWQRSCLVLGWQTQNFSFDLPLRDSPQSTDAPQLQQAQPGPFYALDINPFLSYSCCFCCWLSLAAFSGHKLFTVAACAGVIKSIYKIQINCRQWAAACWHLFVRRSRIKCVEIFVAACWPLCPQSILLRSISIFSGSDSDSNTRSHLLSLVRCYFWLASLAFFMQSLY